MPGLPERFSFGVLLVLALWVPAAAAQADEERVFSEAAIEFFEREVRPVLARRCYSCHSGKTSKPKGGLRLDSRKAALEGGDTGPALEPGNAGESLLIDAVNYGDLYEMPPKSKLPDREIEILTRWVTMGAPWPEEAVESVSAAAKFDLEQRRTSHWCWTPPQRSTRPSVDDPSWPQQDLDAYVLAALQRQGLKPAPQADRRTLIRRIYFDLIGLPPTPEDVARFVEDESDNAFEKVVGDLLDSPHFGERWARHWLDLVRYAETHGHEFDFPIHHASKYRDYLIRAFNSDLPYDQLVIEHLAGDLLDPPRLNETAGYNESVIATAFWWFGEATHAPVDVRDDEARRIDNQIDVMTKTFLGLTVSCARCHDHKFDAISTKDYYSLVGFLKSSRRQFAYLDPHEEIARLVTQIEQVEEQGTTALVGAVQASSLTADRFAERLLAAARGETHTGEGSPAADGQSAWQQALDDERITAVDHPLHAWSQASGAARRDAGYFKTLRQTLETAAAEAEEINSGLPTFANFSSSDGYKDWFVAGEAFGATPTRSPQWDVSAETPQFVPPGLASTHRSGKLQGALRSRTFTLRHPNIFYRIAGKGAQVRLILDGYFMDVFNPLLFSGFTIEVDSDESLGWQRQARDVRRYLGHRAHLEILDHGNGSVMLDEIRFSDGAAPVVVPSRITRHVLSSDTVNSLPALADAYGEQWVQAIDALSGGTASAEQVELINWALDHRLLGQFGEGDDPLKAYRAQLASLDEQLESPQQVLAIGDGTGENERVFIRGNHKTLGSEAPRQLLEALGGEPSSYHGSGRLDLAHQLVDSANPLLARVMVNRVWHHLFGRGLVASVDNFGVLGELPTHPQLLDHLALRFVDEGWSLKSLIRSFVLSRAYQMSSRAEAASLEKDPQNKWLHAMRVRRLQGEAIRDAVLAVSGRLDRKMYGASVPVHITPFMQGRGRPRKSGPQDGNGRRSLYMETRRNFLSPMMLAFDSPIPFSTVGRRNQSNVPAQALIMMNDPFIVEQARHWSDRLPIDSVSAEEIVTQMYLTAFSRSPTPLEVSQSLDFLQTQKESLATQGASDATDRQAWADLAHVLMNVKEFVYLK